MLNYLTDFLGLTNTGGTRKAVGEANDMLEKAKSTAEGLSADTAALMNPNVQNQAAMASDAVMGKFGGAGNLYSSGAMKALADRAQAIGSAEWNRALDKALAMQQGNAQIDAGRAANLVAREQNKSILGELGSALGGAGKFMSNFL